ncbi:hypothetical protein AB0M46_31960 [Dactylosporangium sp. NPDC051485]|uniref:hypothetical protein n=1 Tax=Dactylosporangium sp. NPDC051485 TaxID=3154846 RepID=UPI0034120320
MRVLRRPTWLGALQLAIVGGLVAMAAIGVVNAVALATTRSIEFAMPVATAPGLATEIGGVTVQVVVPGPTGWQLVAHALVSFPTFAVIVTLLALLLTVVHRARRGGPFDTAVIRRLRLLAGVGLIGGVAAQLAEFFVRAQLTASIPEDQIPYNWQAQSHVDIDLTRIGLWILVGVGFMAFAEVVNRGRTLRAELDAVI